MFKQYHSYFRYAHGKRSRLLLNQDGFFALKKGKRLYLITDDWDTFLKIMEYDVERFHQGFSSEQEIWDFVKTSPYFSPVFHKHCGVEELAGEGVPLKSFCKSEISLMISGKVKKSKSGMNLITKEMIPFEEAQKRVQGRKLLMEDCTVDLSVRALTYFRKDPWCQGCGKRVTHIAIQKHRHTESDKWHINAFSGETLVTSDHIYPKSKGGSDSLENRQVMCQPCNLEKADKLPTFPKN